MLEFTQSRFSRTPAQIVEEALGRMSLLKNCGLQGCVWNLSCWQGMLWKMKDHNRSNISHITHELSFLLSSFSPPLDHSDAGLILHRCLDFSVQLGKFESRQRQAHHLWKKISESLGLKGLRLELDDQNILSSEQRYKKTTTTTTTTTTKKKLGENDMWSSAVQLFGPGKPRNRTWRHISQQHLQVVGGSQTSTKNCPALTNDLTCFPLGLMRLEPEANDPQESKLNTFMLPNFIETTNPNSAQWLPLQKARNPQESLNILDMFRCMEARHHPLVWPILHE